MRQKKESIGKFLDAKIFTIIDETSDLSHRDLVIGVIRFVHKKGLANR